MSQLKIYAIFLINRWFPTMSLFFTKHIFYIHHTILWQYWCLAIGSGDSHHKVRFFLLLDDCGCFAVLDVYYCVYFVNIFLEMSFVEIENCLLYVDLHDSSWLHCENSQQIRSRHDLKILYFQYIHHLSGNDFATVHKPIHLFSKAKRLPELGGEGRLQLYFLRFVDETVGDLAQF